MKNILKILISHLRYLIKQIYYILKASKKTDNSLIFKIILCIKFLYCAGIKNLICKKFYKKEKLSYENLMKSQLVLSNDWFSNNITNWISVFSSEKINSKNINILEIGSYEGASAFFFLDYLKASNLQCVETFEGSDEHKNINFDKIKKNFFNNTLIFKERLKVFEGTSDNFFQQNKQFFDLIYIDGSHEFLNVYKDACNSFNFLNQNGIIIFDDFLKKYYKDLKKDPIIAILNFIFKHKKNIKILNVGYQIIIKKIN
tara:strand:+ start:15623 stop:16396 length:774 start_codon:yes stop_codon:yes gene_type:complete